MAGEVKRILCSVDLREDCGQVLKKAFELANATGSNVHVLHVIKPLSDDAMNTFRANFRERDALKQIMQKRIDERRDELSKEVHAICQYYQSWQKAIEKNHVTKEVVEGHPASVIAHVGSQEDISMIVMAANKKNHMTSYAGKVTKGVIKRARVPVVVIPSVQES